MRVWDAGVGLRGGRGRKRKRKECNSLHEVDRSSHSKRRGQEPLALSSFTCSREHSSLPSCPRRQQQQASCDSGSRSKVARPCECTSERAPAKRREVQQERPSDREIRSRHAPPASDPDLHVFPESMTHTHMSGCRNSLLRVSEAHFTRGQSSRDLAWHLHLHQQQHEQQHQQRSMSARKAGEEG